MVKPLEDYYKQSSRTENLKRPKDNTSLYITVFLLAAGFLILVAFVFAFSSSSPVNLPFFSSGKCIAVLNINQELSVEGSKQSLFSQGSAGSENIASIVSGLNNRDDVAGVLFVINSPGGSVVASREIYSSIKNLKKPKVAYFREVAASGAYYISAPMDYIISDPNAITGSIGVIATFSDMSVLFQKVGFNMTSIKSGAHKDIGSPARPLTEEEKQILQGIVNEVFDEFKSVVIENRGKKLNMVKFQNITDGRILSGRQAKEVGLVDQLGSRKDAINKVAELAGMQKGDPNICEISLVSEEKGLFGLNSLFSGLFADNQNSRLSLKFE